MLNEIALTAKASQGDLAAMVDLGGLFAGENRIEEALTWWRKATEGGHGGAAHNLLMTYMMLPAPDKRKKLLISFYIEPQSGNRDPADFRNLAEKLANYKNGWAKTLYGVIVSGGNHMMFVKAFGEDAYVEQRDPQSGHNYIEAGVKLARNSLDYYDYSAIVSAYYRPVDSKEKGVSGHSIEELKKAKEYSLIALNKVQYMDLPVERKAEYEKQWQGRIETFNKQISDRS